MTTAIDMLRWKWEIYGTQLLGKELLVTNNQCICQGTLGE